MSDEALQNAFAELQTAQDDLGRLDDQITRLQENKAKISERLQRARQFIVAWHEFAGKSVPTFDGRAKVVTATGQAHGAARLIGVGRAALNPKKEIVAASALDFIRARGIPIPRHELHELLKARGLDVRGTDPLVTLSTMLWRVGRRVGLLHLKGFGYWDATQPYAPARYVPGDLNDDPPMTDPVNSSEKETV